MARYLIIDENGVARNVIRPYLERVGHVVREVADGASGVAILRTSTVEVLVLDLTLSSISPIEVIRMVKQQRPSVKVVAVASSSRHSEGGVAEHALAAGADVILRTPHSVEYLSAVVHFIDGSCVLGQDRP